jgi:hypothetical protein
MQAGTEKTFLTVADLLLQLETDHASISPQGAAATTPGRSPVNMVNFRAPRVIGDLYVLMA